MQISAKDHFKLNYFSLSAKVLNFNNYEKLIIEYNISILK